MSGLLDNKRFRKLLLAWPEKAIAFLYDSYYKSLLSIAESRTGDRKASEDIVQETFALVWQNRKWLGQQHNKSIQNYLFKVVKNKSISFYRKKVKKDSDRMKYLDGCVNDPIENPAEANIILTERGNSIKLIISGFPRRERECLVMRFHQDMSIEGIAQQLNISKKAVERSLTSARKRLKKYKATVF